MPKHEHTENPYQEASSTSQSDSRPTFNVLQWQLSSLKRKNMRIFGPRGSSSEGPRERSQRPEGETNQSRLDGDRTPSTSRQAWKRRFGLGGSSLHREMDRLALEQKHREQSRIITNSSQALYDLNTALHAEKPLEVKLDGMKFQLNESNIQLLPKKEIAPNMAYMAGKGLNKKAYQLPDGRAMTLPNMDTSKFSSLESAQSVARMWLEHAQEEKEIAIEVRRSGLTALQTEIQDLHVGNASVPVMVAPSFELLTTQGMQVRDRKSSQSSRGNSMIYGSFENAANPERLKLAIGGLLDDTVKIIASGTILDSDSCNLVIQDTPETPNHDRGQLGLFDDRKQKIQFFLFDFSGKMWARNDRLLALLDTEGNPSTNKIKELATEYVYRAFYTLEAGMRAEEREKIGAENWHDFCRLKDAQFGKIKDDLIDDVTKRVFGEIAGLPMAERLKRFSR